MKNYNTQYSSLPPVLVTDIYESNQISEPVEPVGVQADLRKHIENHPGGEGGSNINPEVPVTFADNIFLKQGKAIAVERNDGQFSTLGFVAQRDNDTKPTVYLGSYATPVKLFSAGEPSVVIIEDGIEKEYSFVMKVNETRPDRSGNIKVEAPQIPAWDNHGLSKGNVHNYIDHFCKKSVELDAHIANHNDVPSLEEWNALLARVVALEEALANQGGV